MQFSFLNTLCKLQGCAARSWFRWLSLGSGFKQTAHVLCILCKPKREEFAHPDCEKGERKEKREKEKGAQEEGVRALQA